jgi:hypothetical protein
MRMTEDFMRAYKTTVDFWAEDFKMKPLVAAARTAFNPECLT